MKVFINGIGAITPQGFFPSEDFLGEMNDFGPGRMTAVEPNYKDFISPVKLRRMSKIIKMGLASALMCMNDAQISQPDAIITATGLGAVDDTDKFLDKLIDDKETLLNPTPFIQSTHNAMGGRIAIETSCHGYNMTWVHKNAAFEHALLDAMLKLHSGYYGNILLGAMDEITPNNYALKKHMDYWKDNVGNSELLANNNSAGSIAGEGSVFFSLSPVKTAGTYAGIKGTKTCYKLASDPNDEMVDFIASLGLAPADIDLLLLGINGNMEEDFIYQNTLSPGFENANIAWYKHLCGEYETASGFALMLAAKILKKQSVPDFIKLSNTPYKNIKNILIYQQRFNRNHSFTILSKC
jgi:3-oxoacyl-(acyl-carrier-protein) synthase